MHSHDWVFAFNHDNFRLDEAQTGQFKTRLMGSYHGVISHCSVKMPEQQE